MPLAHPARTGVILALTFLVGLASVTAFSATWQRREDVTAACANVFEQQKGGLTGYRWDWLPPTWVCTYSDGDERRLPLLQR